MTTWVHPNGVKLSQVFRVLRGQSPEQGIYSSSPRNLEVKQGGISEPFWDITAEPGGQHLH